MNTQLNTYYSPRRLQLSLGYPRSKMGSCIFL